MGRRSLRKVDPSLDLSRHLIPIAELAAPLDAAALFGRAARLEVEVGTGKGLFLTNASGEHPDRCFLGCELSLKYARFAAAKLARAGRDNALVVHGDGQRIFRELLPDRCASAVHIYFPDPWWKKRHLQRRILNATFLQDVERALEVGGAFHFWTDVEQYYHATLELIASVTHLEGPFSVPVEPATHDMDYRTHFERRTRLGQLPVHRAEFRRT